MGQIKSCLQQRTGGMHQVAKSKEQKNYLQDTQPPQIEGVDGLTGLSNEAQLEQEINRTLSHEKGVMLMLLNLDNMQLMNDRSGHRSGDLVLVELARLMKVAFFPRDIIGRIDGDTFVVLITADCTLQCAREKGEGLIERIRHLGVQHKLDPKPTVTIGLSMRRQQDTYQTLFSRASKALFWGKRSGKALVCFYEDAMEQGNHPLAERTVHSQELAIGRDMALIGKNLKEEGERKGAYCQDYDTFTCIYRFVERGLIRSPSSVYVVLLTLTDQDRGLVPLTSRDALMRALGATIQDSLRIGDIYTRYSSCQYLMMVLGASQENVLMIMERIRRAFWRSEGRWEQFKIDFSFHPVDPKRELGE